MPHSEPRSQKQARKLLSNMRPLDLPPNINEESAEEREGADRGRTVTPTEDAASGENTTQHQGFNTDRSETDEDESMTTGSGEAESPTTDGNGVMTPETHNKPTKRRASRSADSGEQPRTTSRRRTQVPSPQGLMLDSTLECSRKHGQVDQKLKDVNNFIHGVLDEKDEEIEALNAKAEKQTRLLETMEGQLKDKEEEIEALEAKAAELKDTDARKSRQLEDLQGELEKKDTQLRMKEEQIEESRKENELLQGENRSLEFTISELVGQVGNIKRQVGEIENQNQCLALVVKASIRDVERSLKDIKDQCGKLLKQDYSCVDRPLNSTRPLSRKSHNGNVR